MTSKTDWLTEHYRQVNAAFAQNPPISLEESRDLNAHWGGATTEPGGVDYVEVDAGGVPAMWATPKSSVADRVLLCLHGGGFIGGSMYTHRKMFAHLAKAAGARALIVDYRLTPEHQHPAQIDDTFAAYGWLLDQGIQPGHIAVTGDSAGGGLGGWWAHRADHAARPRPRSQFRRLVVSGLGLRRRDDPLPAFLLGRPAKPVSTPGVSQRQARPLRRWGGFLMLGEYGWVQAANFIVAGVLSLAFAFGLRRALGGAVAGRSWWGSGRLDSSAPECSPARWSSRSHVLSADQRRCQRSKSPLASSARSFGTASAPALRPAVDAFVRQIRYPAAGAP
jgi:acetyl esterase/lipase